MSFTATTHLNFAGELARSALEFYQSVFGGQLMIMTYADAHRAERPEDADLVVWGQVAAESGFRIMAFDVSPSAETAVASEGEVAPFFESLRGTDADQVKAVWDKLSEGAEIKEEIGPAQWSPLYGMLTDKFGVTWVIDLAVDYPAA